MNSFIAETAKWLTGQRPGIVTIDDLVNAMGWGNNQAGRSRAGRCLIRLYEGSMAIGGLAKISDGTYQWSGAAHTTPPLPHKSPGRRLIREEEAEGLRLFEEGASERDVADKLECSASTAHRLWVRLQAQRSKPAQPQLLMPETLTITITPSLIMQPGTSNPFWHFTASDGRKGSLWFHKEKQP